MLFYICFEKEMSKQDLHVVLKFWEYDYVKRTYVYKTPELTNSSNLVSPKDVTRFVKTSSSIALNNKQSICPVCKTRFKSRNRNGIESLPTSPKPCNPCKKKLENEYISSKIEYLEDKLNVLHPVDNFKDISLSYFELLTIYLLIKPTSKKRTIHYKKNKLGLTLSHEVDSQIINSLSTKHLIFEFFEEEYAQITSNDYPYRNSSFPLFVHDSRFIFGFEHADKELVKKLLILFRTRLPKYGIHVLLPRNYHNFLTYRLDIEAQLNNYKMKLDDIKSIQSFIIQQRLDIAYMMVNSVSKFFKLNIEPSVKLDSVLIGLIKNHSIEEVNYITFKNASESKHYLDFINSDFNKYGKKFLFTKNLERTLDFLDGKDFQLFKTKLPKFMKDSKLEIYFNSNVAKKNPNEPGTWQSLSVNEIIALWINSYELDEHD